MASLIALKDIPTLTTLYNSGKLSSASTAAGSTPVHAPNPTFNDKIALIRHDITKLCVDGIVNAAKESLLGGGGVDGAIHRAAGLQLLEECETLDGCDTGDAKITDGYKLPAKKVIHAVGPIYTSTKREGMHETLLRGCYRRSLDLAVGNGCKSIAFSALSTGVYGYPSEEAAEAATAEVRKWLDEDGERAGLLERIVFCNFMQKDEDAYFGVLPKYFPPAAAEGKKTTDEGMKDVETKNGETNDEKAKDEQTKVEETNDEEMKGEETKEEETKDGETKDEETKDAKTKDEETKDEEAKNEETKYEETKDDAVADEADLAKKLPDVPTKEPSEEGQPAAKKAKIEKSGNPTVNKPKPASVEDAKADDDRA